MGKGSNTWERVKGYRKRLKDIEKGKGYRKGLKDIGKG